MPLIKCHECSGQISDHARNCPKCGAPVTATIKRRRKAKLIELGITVIFLLGISIAIWITFHKFMNQAMAPLKASQQQQAR